MQLGQPGDLAVGPFLARELLERGSDPQPERALQASHPIVGIGGAGDRLRELQHVDVGHHRVARARRLQDGSADGRSQPGDRHPQRAGRDPQDVGEPLRSQPARRVERQDREQPPLARTGQVDRRAVDRDRVHTAQQAHTLDRRFRAHHERIVSRRLVSPAAERFPTSERHRSARRADRCGHPVNAAALCLPRRARGESDRAASPKQHQDQHDGENDDYCTYTDIHDMASNWWINGRSEEVPTRLERKRRQREHRVRQDTEVGQSRQRVRELRREGEAQQDKADAQPPALTTVLTRTGVEATKPREPRPGSRLGMTDFTPTWTPPPFSASTA